MYSVGSIDPHAETAQIVGAKDESIVNATVNIFEEAL
jgi:hypothetical protein